MLTIPQTQQILQSYFQTGDMPSQDQFGELIGTMFYLYQDMVNQAAEALAASEAQQAQLTASLPRAMLSARITGYGLGNLVNWQILKSVNIASIVNTNYAANPTIVTFTNPLISANYNIICYFAGSPLSISAVQSGFPQVQRTAGAVTIGQSVNNPSFGPGFNSGGIGSELMLIIP